MSAIEHRLSRDENLLNGDALVRVKYRREGVRRWSQFVVVLDDETDYDVVAEHVDDLIAAHEALA